jgi:phosphomethylpyrimidine synthase
MITTATTLGTSYDLPLHGAHNPSTAAQGTTPGSFAKRADIGGPYAFASPDTPGMPEPSAKTAWDFLPSGWSTVELAEAPTGPTGAPNGGKPCTNCCGDAFDSVEFANARGQWRRVIHPKSFTPITQLESARLGVITPEMKRVAEREPHLTATQVRDEIAAGRMVIPANRAHLGFKLDPMAIGRASKTKINANMGASPVSSAVYSLAEIE